MSCKPAMVFACLCVWTEPQIDLWPEELNNFDDGHEGQDLSFAALMPGWGRHIRSVREDTEGGGGGDGQSLCLG